MHTTPTTDNFLTRATTLTERGIPVVPVEPGAKRCTKQNWPALATTNSEQMTTWHEENPSYNTAAVCLPESNCVLDCDVDLTGKLPEVPQTFTVLSAGKRLPHYYFTHTDRSRALGNRSAKDLFDFQAHRKYVVGPGSALTDGRTYDIVNDAPIAPIPDWLCDWIEQNSVAEKKAFADTHPVADDFDFDDMMAHYGITGDWNGYYYVTDVCPISNRKHEQSTQTGFYFDGVHLGFSCFASRCPGSDMRVGDVLRHLNKTHEPYAGAIWEPLDLPGWSIGTVVYRYEADYKAALDARAAKDAESGYKYPARPWRPFHYVLNGDRRENGWFSRAQVNIIAGSSGAGKSRWMLPLLKAAERGETVLDRVGAGLRFAVVFADRGPVGNQETLLSLGMSAQDVDTRYMPVVWGTEAVDRIQHELECNGLDDMPDVMFVEGADTLVEDANKSQVVAPFLSALGALATHYNVAFILSLGSSKKASEVTNSRDRTFGSIMCQRMSAEMFILATPPEDKGEDKYRQMTINYRNWGKQVLDLRWSDGALVEYTPVEKDRAELSKGKLALFTFIDEYDVGQTFTQQDARKAVKMGGGQLTSNLLGYVNSRRLKQYNKSGRTWYEVLSR